MHLFCLLSLLAALSSKALAHGIVTKIIVGSSTYQGYHPNFQYMPTPPPTIGWAAPPTQDMGPVDSNNLQNPDVICQRNGTPATTSAEVAAGDTVSLQWTPWPESHKGPMLDYLADCGGDCATVDKTQLKFFKIDGVGMVNTSGSPPGFADDQMIANNNTWSVKIPSSIKAGNYVLRHETIALHQAQGVGGAQLYPQCVNLMITGAGSDTPDGVLGTELYKSTDPGIEFNIYRTFTSTAQYTVPGPPLYSGAATGNAAPMATASNSPSINSSANSNSETTGKVKTGAGAEIGEVMDNAQGLISDKYDAYIDA